jgi:hypothetical protein
MIWLKCHIFVPSPIVQGASITAVGWEKYIFSGLGFVFSGLGFVFSGLGFVWSGLGLLVTWL